MVVVVADAVVAVPDSGTPHAIGFAQESGIPYTEGLIKSRYIGRTFIQPTDQLRKVGVAATVRAKRRRCLKCTAFRMWDRMRSRCP